MNDSKNDKLLLIRIARMVFIIIPTILTLGFIGYIFSNGSLNRNAVPLLVMVIIIIPLVGGVLPLMLLKNLRDKVESADGKD